MVSTGYRSRELIIVESYIMLRVLDLWFYNTCEALRFEVLNNQREKGGYWLKVELVAKLLTNSFGHDVVNVYILIELKLVLRSTYQRKRKV